MYGGHLCNLSELSPLEVIWQENASLGQAHDRSRMGALFLASCVNKRRFLKETQAQTPCTHTFVSQQYNQRSFLVCFSSVWIWLSSTSLSSSSSPSYSGLPFVECLLCAKRWSLTSWLYSIPSGAVAVVVFSYRWGNWGPGCWSSYRNSNSSQGSEAACLQVGEPLYQQAPHRKTFPPGQSWSEASRMATGPKEAYCLSPSNRLL